MTSAATASADRVSQRTLANPRRRLWAPSLVIGLTLLTYLPVCWAGFTVWDDQNILYRNTSLTPPTAQSLRTWWAAPHQRLYTPVAYTIWGAIAWVATRPPDPAYQITLDPHVFHVANLLIHLGGSAVAYGLLRRLIGSDWPACAAALVFACHPLQVESVAHASGIQGLLCGFFSLAATRLYLAAVAPAETSSPDSGRLTRWHGRALSATARRWRYTGATVLFVCAVLSKPLGMVVPLLAGSLDLLWLGRPLRRVVRSVGPWLIVSMACGALARTIQTAPRFDVVISPYQRPLIAGFTVAFYLYKVVFPVWLGIVYGQTPAHLFNHDLVWVAWLLPAALARWLAVERVVRRPLIAAAAWFVLAMAPVLGFVRFDFQVFSTVADRYAYLPLFGVAIAVAWGVSRLEAAAARGRRIKRAICVVVLGALAARSFGQALVWHDSTSLFRNAYLVNPAGGSMEHFDPTPPAHALQER